MHIYLQALHDQLHDGGYWRGGFDVRHAWDIADLVRGDDPVDWDSLCALPPTRLTWHAIEAQLMACHWMTGAAIPADMRGSRSWLQHQRQRLQYSAPAFRAPLAAAAILFEAPNLLRHRHVDRRARANAGLPLRDDDLDVGLARLRRVLTVEQGGRL